MNFFNNIIYNDILKLRIPIYKPRFLSFLGFKKIMKSDYYAMATDLLDSGMGEEGRLQFILECIDKNKPLYKTDIRFLESLTEQLDLKIKRLNAHQKTNHPKTLLSDEFLDEHLDKIESKNNTKIQSHSSISTKKKKKSFLRRIFSK